MLPTPSTSHVKFDNIYEPAEDSFLLLDTLSSPSETTFLTARFKPELSHTRDSPHQECYSSCPLILEVGSGSGVVLAFITGQAAAILGRRHVLSLGTDVNGFACRATRETVEAAIRGDVTAKSDRLSSNSSGGFLGPVMANLTGPVRPGIVDVLIFNPPYVPTETLPAILEPGTCTSYERDSHLLSLSYAGGVDGMETTDRLLAEIPTILNRDRGVAYVLLCAQNTPEVVKQRIRSWGHDWKVETVGKSGSKAGWEKLQIIRIWR